MNYLFAILAYLVATPNVRQGCARCQTTRELGSYKLLSPIGEGGMGEVWRASHKMLARPAAIKLVKLDAGPAGAVRPALPPRGQRHRSAAVAAHGLPLRLRHDAGRPPLLRDGAARRHQPADAVTTFGPQPASRVVAILRQMCRSLEEAHGKKIVHRDLKPSNVMICQVAQAHDFVKVLDFGLAKPFGGTADADAT